MKTLNEVLDHFGYTREELLALPESECYTVEIDFPAASEDEAARLMDAASFAICVAKAPWYWRLLMRITGRHLGAPCGMYSGSVKPTVFDDEAAS